MNLSIWEDFTFNPVNFQPSNRGITISKNFKLDQDGSGLATKFQKNICFIDYAKAFDCVGHNKLENS